MAKITKEMILKELPKGYKAYVSKHGMTVLVSCKLNNFNNINDAEKAVGKMAKKLKLDFVGSGTDLASNVRDWEFISLDAEHEMVTEAKDVLKTMKAFFKKWSNAYCSSSKAYDVIEKMRDLIITDEA